MTVDAELHRFFVVDGCRNLVDYAPTFQCEWSCEGDNVKHKSCHTRFGTRVAKHGSGVGDT